jgi:putative FmdB family regulatory protein
MPLYEYKCNRCNDVFEVMQKFSDAPLTVHESCGGGVERLLSSPALQFKGSGWYITDYARSNDTSKHKNGKDSPPSSESKSEKPAPAAAGDSKKSG